MNQFCATNKPKIRLVLVPWGSLVKKIRIQFESCFFRKKFPIHFVI